MYKYMYIFQISVKLMKAEWPKCLEYKSFYISVLFIHFYIYIYLTTLIMVQNVLK